MAKSLRNQGYYAHTVRKTEESDTSEFLKTDSSIPLNSLYAISYDNSSQTVHLHVKRGNVKRYKKSLSVKNVEVCVSKAYL